MFKFAWNRNKATARTGRVGLALESDGFTLCHVVKKEGAPPRVTLCKAVSALTPEERNTALAELVAESKLSGTPCVVVLPPESYSLRLLDRPKVEDDEIASSLPWLIKDLIDFDPSDARVDYFDFPADANRGRDPQLFVAAARNDVIEEVTNLLDGSGLELDAVDIGELALRNLTLVMPEQVAGTLLLELRPKGGILAICHESKLYFARSISTGTSHIDDAMSQGRSRWMILMNNLIESCSFDYAPGTPQRAGLVTIELVVANGGERVRVLHQVHVDNSP
ncbi:MAG: biogenesis protein MshI [Myxococcales bacterium]|nr:biogenesis protein MshI [Myxococcales bacterium]